MSSAGKTLELLAYFSVTRPEIGLSQLCRLAKKDKATTYRYLQTLESSGFIEQNPVSKNYRLGPAVLRLAETREVTVPRKSGAEIVLRQLANATGETAHATVLSGTTLFALLSCESPKHSTRVVVDIQTFPLHATASGICALAYGPAELRDIAHADLRAYTPNTATTAVDLDAAIEEAKRTGFARSNGSFEAETHSLATAVFDHTGLFAGSVSVASVATRLNPDLEDAIKSHLMVASREITRNWGGIVPAHLEQTWLQGQSTSGELEIAS